MNIYYDVFISNPELIPIANSIPEIDESLIELLSFVKGRLMPLKSLIDQEEDISPNEPIATIIRLKPPPEAPNQFLLFGGYSMDLAHKMVASFSPTDIAYIEKRLLTILDRWQQ